MSVKEQEYRYTHLFAVRLSLFNAPVVQDCVKLQAVLFSDYCRLLVRSKL